MNQTESQVHAAIEKVEAAIEKVEAQIEKVEQKLDAEGLSNDDVVYWRNKEEQLRNKEERLRNKEERLRDERLLLLKHQIQGGRPPLHPTEREIDLEHKVDLLLEHTRTDDRATPQYSAALIGGKNKANLMSDNRFMEFEKRSGEESILSAKELEALSKLENEHQVVAFVTPHLEKIFCNGDIEFSVFNSEQYKWIETTSETSAYNEKPDLLICHPAIASRKKPFHSRDTVLNQMREKHSYEYGVLSNWKLRDAVGLTCEAKVSIDNKGFGEVINYGAHLCFGKDGAERTRLILFDKTQCWLVGVVKGSVSDVTTFQWRDEGSASLLRDFIRQSPLTKALTAACQKFHVAVGTDSFLGAGAFGFVFRATRCSDGRFVALKVVYGSRDGVQRLERESIIMNKAHGECPDEVMGVEEDGFAILEDGLSGALLLSQVGEHYSNLVPQSILDSLKTLHRSGILHGDARLDNVVCVDGKPVWIDFADARLLPGLMTSQQDELENLKACVKKTFRYNAP